MLWRSFDRVCSVLFCSVLHRTRQSAAQCPRVITARNGPASRVEVWLGGLSVAETDCGFMACVQCSVV